MSVAELKEKIVKKVVMSDDQKFLSEVEAFIDGGQSSNGLEKVDAFYDRLKAQYGDVLQKLAQ